MFYHQVILYIDKFKERISPTHSRTKLFLITDHVHSTREGNVFMILFSGGEEVTILCYTGTGRDPVSYSGRISQEGLDTKWDPRKDQPGRTVSRSGTSGRTSQEGLARKGALPSTQPWSVGIGMRVVVGMPWNVNEDCLVSWGFRKFFWQNIGI